MKKSILFTTLIYIVLELILFIIFMINKTNYTYEIGFSLIISNFIFSVISFIELYKYNKLDVNFYYYLFVIFGLFSTCFADFYLIGILHFDQALGMICFNITQIMYALFIYKSINNKKINIIHLIVRLSLCAIGILISFVILKGDSDFVSVISILYFCNLIANILFSLIGKINIIFSIGLILFICCDFFIGIQNLDSYIVLEEASLLYKLANINFDIAWMFYIPSQTLISLSILYKKKTSK